jgi:AraC-like DNA-binding protein
MYKPSLILHKIDNVINVTRLVTIHYFEFTSDFIFEGEVHDVWEMVYVDKGEITATADTRTELLRQGDILFHKPNEFHDLRANGKVAPNVFVMTFASTSKLMKFFEGFHSSLPTKYRRLIAAIIEEGRQAFRLPYFDINMNGLTDNPDAPVGAQQMIRLYLEQLLILIVRDRTLGGVRYQFLPTRDDVDDRIAAEIISLLEHSLYDELTIEDVCRQLNYSKTYLSTTFRSKTDYSIKQYYNLLKIAEAKKLIREKQYNFTQIAQMLHFDTSQYFSRVFQRITGMTPTEYSQSILLEPTGIHKAEHKKQ